MRPINIEDFRQKARRRLPRFVFDYLDGGAEDEVSLRANRAAFERIRLLPSLLNDVATRDQGVDCLGSRLPTPLIIAPTGLNGLFQRDGDVVMARAAARCGIPFVLSTASTNAIEAVAERAGGELWFQLYVMGRSIADRLVERAAAAGYRHLVLTADVPLGGKRERDERNGFGVPFRVTPRIALDVLRRPRWLWQVGRHGAPPMGNLASETATDSETQAALLSRKMDASYSWDDLKRLRDRWAGRLLVKGLLDPADVERAFAAGVDAVILSNHGGRQLDGAPAPIEMLAEAGRRARGPLLLDSGVRRGADVVKALALGARAVLIGRAALYGLAVGGEDGVVAVVAMLKGEIDRVLGLLGCGSAAALGPSCIRPHPA